MAGDGALAIGAIGCQTMPWGTIETGVIDPFGNLIRFCERFEQARAP